MAALPVLELRPLHAEPPVPPNPPRKPIRSSSGRSEGRSSGKLASVLGSRPGACSRGADTRTDPGAAVRTVGVLGGRHGLPQAPEGLRSLRTRPHSLHGHIRSHKGCVTLGSRTPSCPARWARVSRDRVLRNLPAWPWQSGTSAPSPPSLSHTEAPRDAHKSWWGGGGSDAATVKQKNHLH